MMNQEFEAQGIRYQVLLNFGICCRELRVLKVATFCACDAQLRLCRDEIVSETSCNISQHVVSPFFIIDSHTVVSRIHMMRHNKHEVEARSLYRKVNSILRKHGVA